MVAIDATTTLARRQDAPHLARRFVHEQLHASEWQGRSADAELLVSEAVTNAVRHAAGDCTTVHLTCNDVVRIEVEDDAPVDLTMTRVGEGARIGSLGLRIIDRLAQRWGTRSTPRREGRLVRARSSRLTSFSSSCRAGRNLAARGSHGSAEGTRGRPHGIDHR